MQKHFTDAPLWVVVTIDPPQSSIIHLLACILYVTTLITVFKPEKSTNPQLPRESESETKHSCHIRFSSALNVVLTSYTVRLLYSTSESSQHSAETLVLVLLSIMLCS